MIKFKCKKDFIGNWGANDHLNNSIGLFKKDEWYEFYKEPLGFNNTLLVGKWGENKNFSWAFNLTKFKEHFYSVEEIREIEINKILE
tara:strand:- start:128509 stop:128769 length:261 start_codon:yes stop_codon:yes gene_type:complete